MIRSLTLTLAFVLMQISCWAQLGTAQAVTTSSATSAKGGQQFQVALTKQESGTTASLRGVCAVSNQVCWASGADGTCIRTIDGGKSWQRLEVPGAEDIDFRDIHAWSADRALVMGIVGPPRFFLTEDGGATWQEVYRNDAEGAFFDAVAFWDEKRGIAFGDPLDGRLALITTSDGGATWQDVPRDKIPPAAEREGGFAASGTCLAVGKDGLALIGLGGDVPGGKARIMRSDDFGASWTVEESPLRAAEGAGVFSLCFAGDRVVAVGGNYMQPEETAHTAMISPDGGKSWKLLEDQTPHGYRSAVAEVPGSNGKALVACGPTGVDLSADGGESWHALSEAGHHAISFAPDGSCWLTGGEGQVAQLKVSANNR